MQDLPDYGYEPLPPPPTDWTLVLVSCAFFTLLVALLIFCMLFTPTG